MAEMDGLNSDCALCKLFAETILPGTYSEMPTDSPWQLRAFRLQYMTVSNQDQFYFQGIPRAALYAGSRERDCLKHKDSDQVRERGLLVVARTRDVQGYASIARSQKIPKTQFTSPQYNPDLARQWIKLSSDDEDKLSSLGEDSQSQHVQNGSPRKPVSITKMKVIDCETLEVINRTDEMEYLALSYVWRLANDDLVPPSRCAVRDSKARGSKIFLPPLIPRVVDNAMTVATDLGFRYLWVDQFCINQSAPKQEINEHVSMMDLIYSLAKLTIIATSTHGALPGVGTTQRSPQDVLDLRGPIGGTADDITFFTTNPGIEDCILDSVWFTRGWCFQEVTLSFRRLYFTDHEMYFETENMRCSESYPEPDYMESHILYNSFKSELSLGVRNWKAFLEGRKIDCSYELDDSRGLFWAELETYLALLQEYMEKEMTLDDDAINGFKGVMKVFSRKDPNFQTLQGLPVFDSSNQFRPRSIAAVGSAVERISGSELSSTQELQDDFKYFRNKTFVNVLR